jgi:hypothetical protein
MPLPNAEWNLLHRVIASAYDHGGDLNDDDRLAKCGAYMLQLVGSDCAATMSELKQIRASVLRGRRLDDEEG